MNHTDQKPIRTGYVITDDGTILVQIIEPRSPWGFALCDDDRSWDGGFGIASTWEAISNNDPRITPEIRERLGWIIEWVNT